MGSFSMVEILMPLASSILDKFVKLLQKIEKSSSSFDSSSSFSSCIDEEAFSAMLRFLLLVSSF